jgi:DNA polymerase II large subunit
LKRYYRGGNLTKEYELKKRGSSTMQLTDLRGYDRYFNMIEKEILQLYDLAREARSKGLDPDVEPEAALTKDMAERVEKLVGPSGIAARIRELSAQLDRESMVFKLAEEIVYSRVASESVDKVAEQALRTTLAVLTEGKTVAPLQGISKVTVRINPDRSRNLAIYYAGPIRSAGGTEQAMTVVVADHVRKLLGLDRFHPTEDEIARFLEEIRTYEREVARFQYHISDDEIRNALTKLPIEVNGVGTDPIEVVSFKNLPRVETNRIRAGALRVVNDGIIGRSRKIYRIVESLGLEGWDWLKHIRQAGDLPTDEMAESMFMEDVVAGRPIFSFPSASGGFRLRYGRARNTGLAAIGIHPATVAVLGNFLAVGTQLKIEGPGKAGIVTLVDSIEPPIVKLEDGSVLKIYSVDQAEHLRGSISKVLFLGDLLISFGEFYENNKPLSRSGYTEEWWSQDVRRVILKDLDGSLEVASRALGIDKERLERFLQHPLDAIPSPAEALTISKTIGVPLHPRYTFFWGNVGKDEILELREALAQATTTKEDQRIVALKLRYSVKEILEKLLVPHKLVGEEVQIGEEAEILWECLRPNQHGGDLTCKGDDVFSLIESISGLKILDKAPTYIGARMGRPEKAEKRRMKPPVHVLFPLGLAGGLSRDLVAAAQQDRATSIEVVRRRCPRCKEITTRIICKQCSSRTEIEYTCPVCKRIVGRSRCPTCKVLAQPYERRQVNIGELLHEATNRLGIGTPKTVKGVRGLTSETKTPEALEKGILRARYDITVYKDGTVRFDATNGPLTHFKPEEIQTPVEKLVELGYHFDVEGEQLVHNGQICEIKLQDIVIPKRAAQYLVRAAKYIDDLLSKFYGQQPYYKMSTYHDLVGHYVLGLAPHTSLAVVARIIGFTNSSVCYAHPLWHAAKRRDCDGDEDALILVLDALLNFSRSYLPLQIGGLMDAPLLISAVVDPREVEDQAYNMDVENRYPVYFYELANRSIDSKVASDLIDMVKHRLETNLETDRYSYTHPTTNIDAGNLESSYKKLGLMTNKAEMQLQLAEKLKAVDAKEVAKKVLATHFMRDLAGNLKAFTTQQFRCTKCNAKFRRVPLKGECSRCGGKISLTVFRGGIEKYLDIAERIAKKYDVEDHYRQRIEIIQEEIESIFGKREKNEARISDYM